jgi:molybdate transport system substrate-binding protein
MLSRHPRTSGLVAALIALGLAATARAQKPPLVAAAADLGPALTEIAGQFRRETGQHVELVFGSSGTLARQIRDGAPFEVFLSADEAFVEALAGAAVTRDRGVLYAVGRIVLFAPTGSPLDPAGGFEALRRLLDQGRVSRFAIANPEHAPYGRAAEAALRKHGLWPALQPRLVLGENVAQAAQFATAGGAVGGVIAYSQALAPAFANRGHYLLIPADDHPPLRQRMVVLKRAGPVATRFYDYLQQPGARAVLERFGFTLPR